MSGGLGPLPYSEISAYARDFPVRDMDRFVRLMRQLDLHYMTCYSAKSKRLADASQRMSGGKK